MKFVEIVETVENIETKLSTLSESKLDLLEVILEEGSEIEFDVTHHIDYLVEFVETQTDSNATIIAETVNGGEVLNIILESLRKNTTDTKAALTEAVELVGEIDIKVLAEDEAEDASVTLLSVVTNTLTEMLGEEAVEALPAEMVFDIVEAAKELDLVDNADELNLIDLVEEISTKLETAINEGTIDLDSDDYEGETLEEFLNDYEDTEDLLEEMTKVTEEILSESEDEDGANLMRKAKEATTLVEAKMEKCPPLDKKCMMKKAKNAKAYYAKNEMPGGGSPKDFTLSKMKGKLGKYISKAAKAARSAGKPLTPDYMQYVLVPGIIKRMRMKNKKMKAKSNMKKVGMK